MTPRPIDHLVLPVASLRQARARYEQLGFLVAEDRQHPFGTENACVFFQNGTYLEPLASGDRERILAAIEERNIFVMRHDAYLFRNGEGFAMLALTGTDADADHAAFAAQGYCEGPVFEFSRKATAPDGSDTILGVRLAHAVDHRAPDCMIFTCQHLTPPEVWRPQDLSHPNGALGVCGVHMEEANPADFQYYLEETTGQREIHASSLGINAVLPNGEVEILTPAGLQAKFGAGDPGAARGPLLRAMTIAVADRDRLNAFLAASGVAYTEIGEFSIVAPAPGQGAFIAFRQVAAQ